MKRLGILLLVISLATTVLMGGTCSKQVRCQISRDCPGQMICGKRGRCVHQCKETLDCPGYQRCIEGECRKTSK